MTELRAALLLPIDYCDAVRCTDFDRGWTRSRAHGPRKQCPRRNPWHAVIAHSVFEPAPRCLSAACRADAAQMRPHSRTSAIKSKIRNYSLCRNHKVLPSEQVLPPLVQCCGTLAIPQLSAAVVQTFNCSCAPVDGCIACKCNPHIRGARAKTHSLVGNTPKAVGAKMHRPPRRHHPCDVQPATLDVYYLL